MMRIIGCKKSFFFGVMVWVLMLPFQSWGKGLPQTGAQALQSFIAAEETQVFSGKPITLQVQDVEVGDVLRMIGEASGFNIVLGTDVKGKLTLSLVDVPWDQALDVVLHTLHLGAERNNNILRVVTLKSLTTEKVEEYRARLAAKYTAPRITKIFSINYAKLSELQPLLLKFSSSALEQPSSQQSNTSSGGGNSVGEALRSPAIIQIDERTNSIVVNDLPDNIEKMRKMIEVLDVETPQVMISAKMVEVTEDFSNVLAGSLGFGGAGKSSFVGSFAGGDPLDQLVGTGGVFAAGKDVAKASGSSGSLGVNSGLLGLSPSFGILPGLNRLNALLSWGESQDQIKIVSSPKTIVLNKASSTIVEGTPVLIPGVTTVAGVGSVQTATVQSANVSLAVKPTVTNDNSVLLDIQVSKDVPMALSGGGSSQTGIGTRNLNTQVLVESGSTLAIGGIYTVQTNHSESGLPFLRKIPLLGFLFGSSSDSTTRSELFFFITPRIIKPKEAIPSSS